MGRTRTTGLVATVLAVAVLSPVMATSTAADAAGEAYKVHSWTDQDGGTHLVRWNPCQTITYAVNVRMAGASESVRGAALKDVQRAFRRAAHRTGLTFSYSGRTTELPRNLGEQSWSDRQQAAEIVVAWVDQSSRKFHSNLLSRVGSDYASGVGGWMLRGWQDAKGRWQAAVGRGFVVINAGDNRSYEPGFGGGVTRGALLLHELGHALGLDHVGSTSELMYPTMLSRENSNYKAGDELGLARVGERLGCIVGTSTWWPQI